MKLVTKEIERKLEAAPIGSTESVPEGDKVIIVKFFYPYGSGTWFVVEGERQEDGDWLFFGFVDLHEREWGYFSLSDLMSVIKFGKPAIERDMYAPPKFMREVL